MFDVCNLLTPSWCRPVFSLVWHIGLFSGTYYDWRSPFVPQVGLTYVRGCEVEGMLDDAGKVIEEGPEPKPHLKGDTRSYRCVHELASCDVLLV